MEWTERKGKERKGREKRTTHNEQHTHTYYVLTMCMYVRTYVCMHGWIDVWMCVCVSVCMYVRTYVCMDGWIDVWMCVCVSRSVSKSL